MTLVDASLFSSASYILHISLKCFVLQFCHYLLATAALHVLVEECCCLLVMLSHCRNSLKEICHDRSDHRVVVQD